MNEFTPFDSEEGLFEVFVIRVIDIRIDRWGELPNAGTFCNLEDNKGGAVSTVRGRSHFDRIVLPSPRLS